MRAISLRTDAGSKASSRCRKSAGDIGGRRNSPAMSASMTSGSPIRRPFAVMVSFVSP
jgi:hypothetical protein